MPARVTGRENVPRTGGALIVANHTTVMDFMMPSWGAWRPVFGIGSEQVFRMPLAGWMLRQLNGAPVAQGVKDKGAVMHLVDAYHRGQLITQFPEGKRSWTGRPLPITAGSGRLVKSLGCPVIYCRILTGYLQHPRWARWPRIVPWVMSYDPPVSYPPDATTEEINRDIALRLAIDPDEVVAPPGSFGFRMAQGLPAFLWACPACFGVETLEVVPSDKNSVCCRSCGATWRVDVSTRLTLAGKLPTVMTVAAAQERVAAHFGRAVDPERWAAEGVAVECPSGTLSRLHRGQSQPERVREGPMRMYADRLEVGTPAEGEMVVIRFQELKAAILEFRSMLVVRTADTTWVVEPGAESPHKWHHFLLAQVRAGGWEVRT